jgi:hypothetical protein
MWARVAKADTVEVPKTMRPPMLSPARARVGWAAARGKTRMVQEVRSSESAGMVDGNPTS